MLFRKSVRLLVVAGFSMVGAALLRAESLARAEQADASASAKERPPRYVPRFALRREGHWIQSGLRLERAGDSLLVGRETFRMGGEPQGAELPEHLGGGFLFYQPVADGGASATAIYRADSWTAPLKPLARVPFPVEFIEAGFDRVYLLGVSVHVALDVESGEILPLDPLPPLASIEALSFSGPRRALVQAPLVGTLYTHDAGLSWMPIKESFNVESSLNHQGLFVRTAAGSQLVEEDGSLSAPIRGRHFPISLRARGPSSEHNFAAEGKSSPAASSSSLIRDARERALMQTLTQGASLKGGAVSVSQGQLNWLRLSESLELTTQEAELAVNEECFGVPAADEKGLPLFVCRGEGTRVLQLEQPPELWSAKNSRSLLRDLYVSKSQVPALAYGPGAVLLASECSGVLVSGLKKTALSACLISSRGLFTVQIPHPKSMTAGTTTSLAVDSERVWQAWVDRKKSRLRAAPLWLASGKKLVARSWQIPKDAAIHEFFESGSLLPMASLDEDELLVWTTSRERFVGFRLGDGKWPTFGAVQRPLKRALFDGPRAMIWGAAGFAKQSVDGGLHFTEASYPYRSGDAELSHVVAASSAVEMGCSPVGCALGRLLRFGWDESEIAEAKLPPPVPLSPRGGQRFRFTCHSGAVDTGPRLAEGTAVFSSFWERAAPALAPGEVGFSVPFSQEFGRLYAWGPQETAWTRRGGAQLRFFDPWSPGELRSSSLTPHLFSSSLEAQDGMGLLDRISGSRAIVFDPAGDRGAFVLRTRNETELFTFVEDAPLQRVKGAEELDLRNLRSAVFAQGRWFVAFQKNTSLAVARVEAGMLEVIAELPLGESAARGPDLVRTTFGDLGVSLVGDGGLLVYPLSSQGELGTPIIVDEKGQRPAACEREATGFIVDVDLSLTPYLELSDGRPIKVNAVRARMIVGHGAPCLEVLVAHTREDLQVPATAATKMSIPLSLLNVDSNGDRKLLSCE